MLEKCVKKVRENCTGAFYRQMVIQYSSAMLTRTTEKDVEDTEDIFNEDTGEIKFPKCLKPYLSNNCDCLDGFFLSSDESCEKCPCSELGSKSKVCDKRTGQCDCKSNYAGPHCNTCADGYYGDKCQFQGEPGI